MPGIGGVNGDGPQLGGDAALHLLPPAAVGAAEDDRNRHRWGAGSQALKGGGGGRKMSRLVRQSGLRRFV